MANMINQMDLDKIGISEKNENYAEIIDYLAEKYNQNEADINNYREIIKKMESDIGTLMYEINTMEEEASQQERELKMQIDLNK